jgi:hypothetical protein
MKKLTTEQFVERAIKIHNNKYDYSKVEYKGSKIKIIIICPRHGEFLQRPFNHLNERGCLKCSIEKRKPRFTEFEKKKRKSDQDKKYRLEHSDELKNVHKIYYQNNKEEIKRKHKIYNINNKEQIKSRVRCYRLEHKEDIKCQRKGHYLINKDRILRAGHKYQLVNKDKIKQKKKKYYIENEMKIVDHVLLYQSKNKKKRIEYMRHYTTERRKRDINFMLQHRIRNRIYMALKNNSKAAHTLELIGCSIKELKAHLESTAFKNGYSDFSMENFDGKKWHIDHIIPCCIFNLSDPIQQKKCFNYKNLQILSAKENLIKKDKICL